MVNKIFINNNLILKKLVLKNINENYLSWVNNTDIKKKIDNINFQNLTQLKDYYYKQIKKPHLLFFGIFYKGKHVGNVKFENIYKNSTMASWGILIGDKNFRGKKIGYQVLSKSMNYFERKYKIKKFTISVGRRNFYAKKLYYDLGFRFWKNKKDKIFLIKRCMSAKIILGSANFDNIYGLRKLYVKKTKVKKILKLAKKNGINFIDTANIYGKSEEIIGRSGSKDFEIISKLPKIDKEINIKRFIKKKLNETLKKLKKKSLYAYLVHNSNDLFNKTGKITIKTLSQFKRQKLIKKIGVSVYEVDELKKILKVFKPDIVQLPINILNQSFLKNNFLNKIKKLGIEIHVRSIFLQGMLLDKKFSYKNEEILEKVNKIDKICKKNKITKLGCLMGFITNLQEVDKILIGVDNVNQLKNIIKNIQNPVQISNSRKLAITNLKIVDPRSWKKN